MKKTILVLLIALCLGGCGFQARPQGAAPSFKEGADQPTTAQTVPAKPPEQGSPAQEPVIAQKPTVPLRPDSFGTLLDGSILSGAVMDFTENGCSLSEGITQEYENGFSSYSVIVDSEAAAREGLLKAISYQPDCVFLYVYVNATTGSIRYEDAVRENVKKDSSLVVYGETDGEGTVRASRVYLERFEH